MEAVNKEQYKSGKYNYMLFNEDWTSATTGTDSSGRNTLKVYNFIVNADGTRPVYMRVGYKNANFENRPTYVEGNDNAAYSKVYVLDSNGNPIDWRGVMYFEDIDTTESISIQSSCIEKFLHYGSNLKAKYTDTFSKETSGKEYATTYTVMVSNTGSIDGDQSYQQSAACIVAHIPKEGMWIRRRYGTIGAAMKNKTWEPSSGAWTIAKFTIEGSPSWKSIP